MKLEQHFYTSGKTEYTTVAATDGISREEQIQLENQSIYFLPVSLHYQEDITTPVKYMFYPLGKQRFVVGRAVYKGKDSLGRTGNYLFHNYVLSQEDLMTACHLNPASLIKALNQQTMFCDDAPEQAVESIEFASDDIPSSSSGPQEVSRDLLLSTLSTCIHHDVVHQPLLLLGSEEECLEFLERLYTILPYDIRLKLCADTYAYGVSLGFQIVGSLEEEEFRQGLLSSLTVHLGNLDYTIQHEMPEPSRHLTFIGDMAIAGRIAELDAVFSLEHCLRQNMYGQFKQEYQMVSPELQNAVWEFHEDVLLNHITAEQDTELLYMIQEYLQVENIDTLYLAPEMIQRLIETGEPQNLEIVAAWLCTEGSKVLFHPYLFHFHELWKVFLERIRTTPQDAGYLLEPVKAFQEYYATEFEETLLTSVLPLLPVIREDRKLAKEFFKAFEALPDIEGYVDAAHLQLLRSFVKYELNRDAELLEQLVQSDLSGLTESQQRLVCDTILDRLLILRSLQIWNPEKVEQQLGTILENAAQDQSLLLVVLASMEKLQLSKEAHKVVEKTFADLREKLQTGDTTLEIERMINRVLKPPASLFTRLTEKLLGGKGL